MMGKDEAIAQIRETRHRISEEHGHNPQKLVDYYIELQKQYPHLSQFKESLKVSDSKRL
jgi:hypothetical protein